MLAHDLTIRTYSPLDVPTALRVDNTPWGPPTHYTYAYAPGGKGEPLLLIVETASHGGMCPHESIGARIPQAHRDYAAKWAKGWNIEWYEEDCAWAAVAIAAPELFSDEEVEHARAIANRFLPHVG